MNFYSISFVIFFVLFSVIINYSPSIKIQRNIFLIANIVFYGFWDYRFLLLLSIVVLIGYFSGIQYNKCHNKIWIDGTVIIYILILGVFKYFNFFSESFSRIFGVKDYVTLNLILPLGISFYLFQAMSYLFDIKYGKIEVERDFIKLATYISFFPQITAGPIVKSKDFLPQLEQLHRIKKDNLYVGIQLIVLGITKKIVFADRIGIAVDAVYTSPVSYNGISVLLAVIGYSLQIYCDFSGYSNIAIGIARIWDFDLGANFNAPYIAKNPSDFWRRWHISLSTWFRDYVYIPLGGSRKGTFKTYFNLFITMVLSGIWHGANSTFIVWGIVHGFASALNRGFNDYLKRNNMKVNIPSGLSILINYIFVSLAWVIFRADSFNHALTIYKCIFNTSGLLYVNVYVLVFIIIYIFINLLSLIKNSGNIIDVNLNLDSLKNKFIISVWIWLIVVFMYCGNSAFIYAQF